MTESASSRERVGRLIKLPNREAFRIAMQSVKIRLGRSFVTMAGIILAIAFLSAVLISGVAERALEDDPAAIAERAESGYAKLVWLITISLLVCVVGITNAMLMSVTERFREIGTMKCLGALDWFVIKLFLMEAGVLGLVGSALGACLGFLIALLISLSQYEQVFKRFPWGTAILMVLAAIVVGTVLSVIGAIYPASRAGKMPPADAMRTEI